MQDSCSDGGTQDWLPQDKRVRAFIEKDGGMYDAVNRGLGTHIIFNGVVSRTELLKAYLRAHLFVYLTLHDSSSSAIPEAYSAALPTFTLALGGTRMATDPQAGFNQTPRDIDEWMEQGTQLVKGWIANPDGWLTACAAAHKKRNSFLLDGIIAKAREHLCPCFDAIVP